jgi:hypothetical protein
MGRSVQGKYAERLISPFLKEVRELREGALSFERRKDEGLPSLLDPCVQGIQCAEALQRGLYRVSHVIYCEPSGNFRSPTKGNHQAVPAEKIE